MALLLPTRWQKQPQQPVKIDWSHPLSKGLAGLWIFNKGQPYNLVTGEKATGTFTRKVNNRGVAYNANRLTLASNLSTLVSDARNMTLYVEGDTAETGSSSYIVTADNGTNFAGLYYQTASPYNSSLYGFFGSVATTARVISAVNPASKKIITSSSASSRKIYSNGRLLATNSNALSTFSITTPLYFGGATGNETETNANVIAVWDRQLTDKEAFEASRNIYQLLKPQQRLWVTVLNTSGSINLDLPTLDIDFVGLQLGAGDVAENFALDLPSLDISANGLVGSLGDISLNYGLDLFLNGGAFTQANLAFPLPALNISFDGLTGVREPINLDFATLDIELVGEVGVYGDINLDLPVFDVSLEGAHDVALELPALDIAFNGLTGVAGNINLPLPNVDLNFNGLADSLAGFDLTMLLDVQFTGMVGVAGDINLDIPASNVSMTSLTGTAGDINLTLPEIDILLNGGASVLADIDLTVPALLLEFYGNNQSTVSSRIYNRWTR